MKGWITRSQGPWWLSCRRYLPTKRSRIPKRSIFLVLPKTKICYAYWYLSWNAETIPKVNDGSLRHSCRPNLLKVSMKCMLFHHGKSWPRNMWLKKHKKSQEEILHCFTTSKRTPVHRRLNIDWISSWVFTQCHQEKVLQMGKQT